MIYRNLAHMSTPSERLASLIMPRLDADRWSDASYRDSAYALLDLGVGGFGIFLGTLEETAHMLSDLRERAGRRLFFGADYEYGLPMRLRDGGIAFPRAMALGKTLPGITDHVAEAIATEMRALGIHWNWAPVCDINSDPQNPIINVRAFGEDAATVGTHAAAFVRGLQNRHVLACAKHAPGHGATRTDSHVSLPFVDVDVAVATSQEFAPFQECIAAGVGSIMMGHLVFTSIDGDLPASLSAKVVDLVRSSWGFDALIVTDALDMGAITRKWTSGDAALLAFQAGCDCLLLPENVHEAHARLVQSFEAGLFDEARIEVSERRWAAVKERYLLSPSAETVDQNAHAFMALKAADAAISVRGNTSVLPIQKYQQIAAFAVVDDHEMDIATTWFHYLAQATELNIDFGFVDGTISNEEMEALTEGTKDAELLVFVFFGSAVAHRGSLPGMEQVPAMIERLAAGKHVIAVVCGSPYGLETLPADATIFTYSDTTPSLAASVLRLIGRSPTS